jgi:hypothetical protein
VIWTPIAHSSKGRVGGLAKKGTAVGSVRTPAWECPTLEVGSEQRHESYRVSRFRACQILADFRELIVRQSLAFDLHEVPDLSKGPDGRRLPP